jgi:hypothetical protein
MHSLRRFDLRRLALIFTNNAMTSVLFLAAEAGRLAGVAS